MCCIAKYLSSLNLEAETREPLGFAGDPSSPRHGLPYPNRYNTPLVEGIAPAVRSSSVQAVRKARANALKMLSIR